MPFGKRFGKQEVRKIAQTLPNLHHNPGQSCTQTLRKQEQGNMNGQIYRQRRRLIVAGLAAMLAVGWQWQTGAVAALAGALAVAVAIVIIMLFPVFRRGVESAAIGLLLAALLPGPALAILPFWVLLGGVVYYALYGHWADRGNVRLGLSSRRLSQSELSRADVWKALIPGESHPEDHWSGQLVDFDSDPDDPETVYLTFEFEPGVYEDMTLTFLERMPLVFCRYYLERDLPGTTEETSMTIDLTEAANGRTEIATLMETDALLPRLAFARWFDDVFGDEMNRFARTIAGTRHWTVTGLGSWASHIPGLTGWRAKA